MKILLGMSGGVDSTFAALKLLREGNTVEGAVLKMHDYTTVDEAKESAAALGIPLHVLDCREDFEREVVQDLISKYRAARTPNPCVVCNRTVKFERLLRYALSHGFDAIATGHYAAVVRTGEGRYALRRAKDTKKDQTYMLWRLSQEQLSHLILPLSDLHKEEVRAASSDAALEAADRSDSQEICFLPDGDHAAFIESCTGRSPSRVGCWAATGGSSATPSGSARGWASPPPRVCSSQRSIRREIPSRSRRTIRSPRRFLFRI